MTRHFGRIFLRQSVRNLLRHPALAILNVLSVALGVAVFLAIQSANRSALSTFSAGIDLVAGKADLEVSGKIDEKYYPLIRDASGVTAATPIVQSVLALPDFPGEYIRLVGVDPFTNAPFDSFQLADADGEFDLEQWLRFPNSIALTASFAERLGLEAGDTFRVQAPGGDRQLVLRFILADDSLSSADPRFAAMDIGWAQELLGGAGKLSSILILTDEQADRSELEAALAGELPATLDVAPPSSRSDQTEAMLSSFQLNLTALSLVSMLVGVFFIYNTISTSVIRRTTDIAILRSIGATRNEVRALFLAEAGLAGLIGSCLGVLFAIPLAGALLAAVSETISSLYVLMSIERPAFSAMQIALAIGLGVLAALVAAWLPANEAARVDPARALHPGSSIDRFEKTPPQLAAIGVLLLAGALLTSWWALAGGPRLLGFLSAFLLIVGFSLLVPAVSAWVCRMLLRHVPTTWILIRLGVQNLRRSLHRSSITIAALAAAVAMTVGIEVMIKSFRETVGIWVNEMLVADLYIGPAVNEIAGLVQYLPQELEEWVQAREDVRAIATYRELTLPTEDGPIILGVPGGEARSKPQVVGGDSASVLATFEEPDHVLISESLAQRRGYQKGDQLELPTSSGRVSFTIAGVYTDYMRDSGIATITRENFERRWGDSRFHSLAVQFVEEADLEEFDRELRERFAAAESMATYTNRSIKERAFAIFDQTFAVTYVLRGIAIIVSVLGVVLSLTAFVAERTREIGVLRSIGASPGNLRGIFSAESALIGVLAAGIGTVSGIFLAMILTWVINRVFFGWTIQLEYDPAALLAALVWMPPAAALAALLPASRANRIPPAAALRYE